MIGQRSSATPPSCANRSWVYRTEKSPQKKLHIYDIDDPAIIYDTDGIDWYTGLDDSDSDKFKIGTGIAVGTNVRLTITTGGNVGIGTKNSDPYKLFVNGNTRTYDLFTHDGGMHSYSDERLKIIKGSYRYGLEEINNISPIYFKYKDGNELGLDSDKELVGLIAQEVQKIIPDAVEKGDKGYLTITNGPIIYAMLNAIKELKVEIETLKVRLNDGR